MTAYTFHCLSDADFEDLACDLLGSALGLTLQPFTRGRDSGIDLLHGARIEGATIVQCKHYCRSEFSQLSAAIEHHEVPKLNRIRPKRFILVTSLRLTPNRKQQLLDLLGPHCQGVNDILGCDDLNALLRNHPKVETAHYKLWLTSVPVLQRVLMHGASLWNSITKGDIEQKMSVYVQTRSFEKAIAVLAEHNFCILSGIPGIGKTTLAQVLVTRLMEDGYQLISVRDNIRDAFDQLDPSAKQVVYYDDFLGQSSIGERLGKNEDQAIVRLLTEARRGKHLKVVFTTREYILQEARQTYEPINRADLDVGKCILEIEDYDRGTRARILYNHIYFSGLTHAHCLALRANRAYLRIIDHKGFILRFVEWMTLGAGHVGVHPDKYVDTFVAVLDNPSHLWQHAFENQIGSDARAILYCLGSFEGCVGLEELRTSWGLFQSFGAGLGDPLEEKRCFLAAMKQLEGSFTRSVRIRVQAMRGRGRAELAVEFHNPSIKDYVRRLIVADTDIQRRILGSALFFDQVECLARLGPDGTVKVGLGGVVSLGEEFMDAVRRGIAADPATYREVSMQRNWSIAARPVAEIGERLSTVAEWADTSASKRLISLLCELAEELIHGSASGLVGRVSSCEFLEVILRGFTVGDDEYRIIQPFVSVISERMKGGAGMQDWIRWSSFVRDNRDVFGPEEVDEWSGLAESFCIEEIDTIADSSESSTMMKAMLDDVGVLAAGWGFCLSHQTSGLMRRIAEQEEREDSGADDGDDWRESGATSAPQQWSDPDIDRLFGSLGKEH